MPRASAAPHRQFRGAAGQHSATCCSCCVASAYPLPAAAAVRRRLPSLSPCPSLCPPPAAAGAGGGGSLCLGGAGAHADWPHAADADGDPQVPRLLLFCSCCSGRTQSGTVPPVCYGCHAMARSLSPAASFPSPPLPACLHACLTGWPTALPTPAPCPACRQFLVRQWIHQWGRFLLFVAGFYYIPVRGWHNMRAAEECRCGLYSGVLRGKPAACGRRCRGC